MTTSTRPPGVEVVQPPEPGASPLDSALPESLSAAEILNRSRVLRSDLQPFGPGSRPEQQ